MDPHRLAELRSIALHRAVATRLSADPKRIEDARARVRTLVAGGKLAPFYGERWLEVLAQPLDAIVAFLGADTERARELRQASPFAGILAPRERWEVWRSVGESG